MHRDARPPQLGQEVDGSDGRRLLAGIRFHLVAEQHLVGVGAVGEKREEISYLIHSRGNNEIVAKHWLWLSW